MVTPPLLARNVASCCCAASANGKPAPARFVRNVCGFLLTAPAVAAYARSLRKSVARAARFRFPARRIVLVVGFGTVLSPRANWTSTFDGVTSGAYAAGFAACCAHSALSMYVWIAEAPGT